MKQSKPSQEGAVPNALAFLNACPSLCADGAGAQDLDADLSELSRLSCLTGAGDSSAQTNGNRGAEPLVSGATEAPRTAEAKASATVQGFVSSSSQPLLPPAAEAPCRDTQMPEDLRIARELHDAVSQKLFAANLLAGALARSPGADTPVREQAQVLERLNRSALAEMRMMLFELQPEALNRVRLPELLHQAVEALAGRGGVEVTTDMDDSAPLCPAQRQEVYRIATGLLSNVAKHSGASHAHLQWSTPLQGPAVLRVCDDGCGFAAGAAETHGSGLARVRSLASSLGATLVIDSAPGEGTEVTLTFQRSPYES